jgi:hypothetical protein
MSAKESQKMIRRISQSKLQRRGFEKAHSLSSLRRCGGTREEEELKEQIADEILSAAQCDPVRPVRTERQMARLIQGRHVIRIDAIAEAVVSERPSQSTLDELKFLIKLTPLTKRERFFLRGWMLGWTQIESSTRWLEQFGPEGRYTVCRVLKDAIGKCSENSQLSFDAISRHAVYRNPSHRSETWHMTTCKYCKEPFIRGFGDGAYCNAGCRDAFGHRDDEN